MSLSFNGTSDTVTLAGQTLGTLVTVVASFNALTQGETNRGSIFEQGGRFRLRWNGTAASKKLQWYAGFGTAGRWDMTTGFANVTGDKWAAAAFNAGSLANDPTFWVVEDGVLSKLTIGAGVTEAVTPSGALTADNLTIAVSEDGATSTSAWNGRIGELAVWTRILSDAEIEAVWVEGPLILPGMHLYWPFDDTGTAHARDFSGNGRNGTISGAVRAANIFHRPAMRRG